MRAVSPKEGEVAGDGWGWRWSRDVSGDGDVGGGI